MEWSTAIVGVPGCCNKPNVPVGDYCVGLWIRPLADNTILHLSEFGTGGFDIYGIKSHAHPSNAGQFC